MQVPTNGGCRCPLTGDWAGQVPLQQPHKQTHTAGRLGEYLESPEIDIAAVTESTKAPRVCICRCSSPGRAALFPGKQVSEVIEGHF